MPESLESAVAKPSGDGRLRVLIASWLEAEQVERIRACAPGRIEVLYAPELLPVPRYVADHSGTPPALDDGQRRRWLELLGAADIMFDFDWLDPAALPRTAPRLRWVQGTSAGIGQLLRRTGLVATPIAFTTASGVHAQPLAEFVLLGLLYFVRDVPMLLALKAEHRWQRFTSRSLAGRRVLVVGLGSIGSAAVAACAGIGMEVWGTSRTAPRQAVPGLARYLDPASWRDALGQVDALVLACPSTDETHHLIGAAEIARLPAHAVIVNIARGVVVEEPALLDALRSGRLGGAALDVTYTEPLPADSPLWDLDNVLIAHHSASTVADENRRIVDIFLENLRRYLDGRQLANLFDRQRGY
ncbi:MAG: D-2-hydroxyacid dehydrogenase [Dongiaceae bacterium]